MHLLNFTDKFINSSGNVQYLEINKSDFEAHILKYFIHI